MEDASVSKAKGSTKFEKARTGAFVNMDLIFMQVVLA